jgi:hypothetical protein
MDVRPTALPRPLTLPSPPMGERDQKESFTLLSPLMEGGDKNESLSLSEGEPQFELKGAALRRGLTRPGWR